MARTNIEIDAELLAKAMRLTGAKSKREVVYLALRRLVAKGGLYDTMRRLRGQVSWDGNVTEWRSARSTR